MSDPVDTDLCTLSTCDLSFAFVDYRPSLTGNALFIGIFGVLLIGQVIFGIRYRTWGFMGGMLGGLILELIGYGGRVMMYNNPFSRDAFLTYLVCLTIGPAFLAAAIYLCLARIVVIYGEHISRLKPRTYTILFISCDILSLVLQAIGGGMASNSDTKETEDIGVNVMIAGLAMQVASLLLFIILSAEFAIRCHRRRADWEPMHEVLRRTLTFRAFLYALGTATVAILIRSVFRVAELSQGFEGSLANDQSTFMVLDGAMIIVACTELTALHPGFAFQGNWGTANFRLRTRKGERGQIKEEVDGTPR
ncbi:MAG: hypothetical protein M1817_006220 [Caeruleum heppii]|nr:MAG: hypothetical protein M1817_006220 [Caeruleum heppii]